jgi:putative membrane protein
MGIAGLVILGVLIYLLFKVGTGGFGSAPHETPLDVLKKRYARSEITKEQFDEMKKDL